MISIRGEKVALDTNVWIFALRKDPNFAACETLVFDRLSELQIHMPLQIFVELQHNLAPSEMRRIVHSLTMTRAITWDYTPARPELVRRWEQCGAKKGDAVIAAHLEEVSVRYLISENRDFLTILSALPFPILSSEEAVRSLE